MKEIYSFEIFREKEVVKREEKIENGETVEISKKVVEKVPVKVVIAKPTRRLLDEAELVVAAKKSECIKRNIVTKAMLTKRFADSGGILSEEEAKGHAIRYSKLADLQLRFARLLVKERTDGENGEIAEVKSEMDDLQREIAEFESSFSQLYEHTADVIALKTEILYYTLFLTHIAEENDKGDEIWKPYFSGQTYEEKLDSYYEKEESEDDFYVKLRLKAGYFISFWRNGVAVSKPDFDKINQDIEEGVL